MNHQNPNFRDDITCQRCKHVGTPIMKMGGLICEKCRIIVHDTYSDEWFKVFHGRSRVKEEKK